LALSEMPAISVGRREILWTDLSLPDKQKQFSGCFFLLWQRIPVRLFIILPVVCKII